MKIDLEKAKNEFLKYVENYDLEDENIKRKKFHSLRVMEISERIAKSLKLNQEEIELATLIGLLHDIGRFEQYKRYSTFNDLQSIDHGDLGAHILDNDLRKYIETDEYDNIIKTAIKNHNKYKIEEELNNKEEIFAKIIRDADKIDIFFEAYTQFWSGKEKEIEESKISDEVLEEFKKCTSIKKNSSTSYYNSVNKVILIIAFAFDINFEISFKILKEEDYINKILSKYDFKDEKTKNAVEEIRNIVNEYIKKQI